MIRVFLLALSLTWHFSCAPKKVFQVPLESPPSEVAPQKVELPLIIPKISPAYFAEGKRFAVATQGPGSTLAAEKVLSLGGNLIDAFVASSFAISVERPQSTGLGGGGFLIFHHAKDNQTYAFDFRESAPKMAFAEMYVQANGELNDQLSKEGVLAVAVPGLVAGLFEIHREFGSLAWSQLLEPAIELAETGISVYPHLEKAIEQQSAILKKDPSAKKIFFDNHGSGLRTGDLLLQKDLARSLREIQKNGRMGFYNSWISRSLLDLMSSRGGLIQKSDLDSYEVKKRDPLSGSYRDFKIVSMPAPSAGGIMILQVLNILENASLSPFGSGDPRNLALTASSLQQAFADRAEYLGDPDFGFVPTSELIDKNYGLRIFRRLQKELRVKSSTVDGGLLREEPTETVHMSLMDSEGNAISSTQTINGWFGAGVVIPKTGIFLNNEMDDFSTQRGAANLYGAIGGDPNKIEALKRPLSSMSPSLVFDQTQKGPILSIGSPSGTRIVSCVLLSLLNLLEYKKSLEETQLSLRYHHQWKPDRIFVEEPGFSRKTQQALESMGFEIEKKDLGCQIQAVQRGDLKLIAISDPRGEGSAFAK